MELDANRLQIVFKLKMIQNQVRTWYIENEPKMARKQVSMKKGFL